MKEMDLVTRWDQIEKNLHTFASYRNSTDPVEREFYAERLKRGICIVACEHGGKILFGPSRFVGYIDNNLDDHTNNRFKDGRETNPAIDSVLGYHSSPDIRLLSEHERQCHYLGVEPTVHQNRRFWHET